MIRKVLRKELLEQMRDRRTLFLSVLLPLLMVPGLSFLLDQLGNDSKEEKPQVVIAGTWSEVEKSLFMQQTGLSVISSKQPKQLVEDGKAVAYIIKPEKAGEVQVYLPKGEQENNALIQTQIEKYLLSLEQPQSAWKVTPTLIGENNNPLLDSMNFYFLSLVIGFTPFIGGMGAAIDAIAGERERGTLRTLHSLPIRPYQLWVGKCLNVFILSLVTSAIALAALILIQPFMTQPVVDIGWINHLPISQMIGITTLLLLYICFLSALLLIISTFSKSIQEAQSYTSPMIFLAMAPTFLLMMEQGQALPSFYPWIPFFNMHSFIWEGVNQVVVTSHLWIAIGTNLFTLILAIGLGVFLFRRQKQQL